MSFEPSPSQFKSAAELNQMGARAVMMDPALGNLQLNFDVAGDQDISSGNVNLKLADDGKRTLEAANQRNRAYQKYNQLKQFAPSNSRAPQLQKAGMDRNALLLRQTGRRADYTALRNFRPSPKTAPQPALTAAVKPKPALTVAPKMVIQVGQLNNRHNRAELRLVGAENTMQQGPKPSGKKPEQQPAQGLNPVSDLLVAMRPSPTAQRRRLLQHAM